MASQQHGFDIENDIKIKVFKIDKKSKYTAIHDIDKNQNIFNNNENISVKVSSISAVCFGSPLRILNYSIDETHTGIVVLTEQVGNIKYIKRIVEIDLDNKSLLFGDVSEKEIVDLETLIKSVPKNEKPKELIKQIHAVKKELNKKSGILKFNPKIDSKSQRRLQCSIPKFEKILKENPSLLKCDTITSVRGVEIASEIQSSKRVRNTRKDNTSLAL